MENPNLETTAARDPNGRFLPGQSGNPAGKRRGTRNRATVLRAMMEPGDDRLIAGIVVDKAKAGDAVAARFVLGLLCPRPRGRAIALDLPEGARPGDTVAAFNATLQAMAAGEITPDEALTITRVLDGRLAALNAFKLQRELTRFRGDFIRGDELFLAEEDRFREPGEVEEAEDEEVEERDAGSLAEAEPSPACGRGQGEGLRRACDRDDSDASGSPHPNPPERLSKGPQAGEGMMGMVADDSPANRLHPGASPSDAAAEDLHSACIEPTSIEPAPTEPEQEAESAARLAAERKLSQWRHVIAAQPGFDPTAYIEAEVQRSAALKRSSASLPGHNSRSASSLNGVGTVLR